MDDRHLVLWRIAALCATVFTIAIVGEHRRSRRRDPDRVGWMPWTTVQLAAILGMVFAVAMALTGR